MNQNIEEEMETEWVEYCGNPDCKCCGGIAPNLLVESNWSRDIPTENGWYWTHGWLFGATSLDANKPRLEIIRVVAGQPTAYNAILDTKRMQCIYRPIPEPEIEYSLLIAAPAI